MEIDLSIEYKPSFGIHKISSKEDAIKYREKFINKVNNEREQWFKQPENQRAKVEMPSIEKYNTTMEPLHLRVHLDESFNDRSYHNLINPHTTPTKIKISGKPINGNINYDATLVLSATNKTLNQYGVICNEDTGVAYVPLYNIVKAKNGSPITTNVLFRSNEVGNNRGIISIKVHSINMEKGTKLEHKTPESNIKSNLNGFNNMVNSYLSEFVAEFTTFVPVSKGAEQINCPLYPSENTFIGGDGFSGGNGPLPIYVRYQPLDVDPSFYVNLIKIIVDRRYPSDPSSWSKNGKRQNKYFGLSDDDDEIDNNWKDVLTNNNKISTYNFHLFKYFIHLFRSPTKKRCGYFAKFITLYIQTMDYLSDITLNTENGKKTSVEMFTEIFVNGAGDCEDSGKGNMKQYSSFIDTSPHLVLLWRCLSTINKDEGNLLGEPVKKLLLAKLLPNKSAPEILLDFNSDETFWSNITEEVFSRRSHYLDKLQTVTKEIKYNTGKQIISINKDPEDMSFMYYGGNLECLIYCLIVREFYRIGCFYVDTLTLFGTRDTHVQNLPKTGSDKATQETEEEKMMEKTGGGHGALILWPFFFFRESVKLWDPEHDLSKITYYESWMKERGITLENQKNYFPPLNIDHIEPLILEGTGMLRANSEPDKLKATRKRLHEFAFLSFAKKEIIQDHTNSPFYQSVIWVLTSRFLNSHRISTFNVSQKIDLENMNSKYSEKFISSIVKGMARNINIVSKMTQGSPMSNSSTKTPKENNHSQFINHYIKNHVIGDTLYTKGVLFSQIMTSSDKVVLIPFGFAKKTIVNEIEKIKAQLPDNDEPVRLKAKIGSKISEEMERHTNNPTKNTFTLSEMNTILSKIKKEYLLPDEKSICEFNKSSLLFIDSLAKQSVMVPRLSLGKNFNQHIKLPNKNELLPYKELKAKFGEKIDGEKMVRISIFLKEEQLPKIESGQNLANEISTFFSKDQFVKSIDYVTENYTSENSSVRIDFYVKNIN
jgi:hypothetical protein